MSRLALAHEWAVLIAWAAVGACGIVAGLRLPVAMFPDIVFPVVVVVAEAPGYSVADVERALLAPIEPRLLGIAGHGDVTETVSPGRLTASIGFPVGVGVAAAEAQVRAALASVPPIPGGHLQVMRLDLNEAPIATYAIAPADPSQWPAAVAATRALAARIAPLPGIARVAIQGADEPGGAAATTRVALDGTPALALEIVKEAGANTLAAARAVDAAVAAMSLPTGVRIVAARAAAPFIREATGSTFEAVLAAVVLAVLVIYPFLRSVAATLICALAIPLSLFGTFLVMALAGFQFETITLLALALVIGIIIDDAIVDVENIARHLPQATDAKDAVLRATDEIGLTITAASLTIVAVFVPVGLMGGVVGVFFRPFGLTISAAVLTSLLVARTLSPVLAMRWLRAGPLERPLPLWERCTAAYRELLARALARPAWVLGTALLSLLACAALVPLIPQGFIPVLDRGACDVHFSLAPGASLEDTAVAATRLARIAAMDRDVASVLSIAGPSPSQSGNGVLLVDLRKSRSTTTRGVQERLRRALGGEAGVHVSVENVPIIPVAAPQPLEITLAGDDPRSLAVAARAVHAQVAQWPGVADLSLSGIGADGTWLRRNGHPVAVLDANLAGSATLASIGAQVRAQIPASLPAGVHLGLAGESAQAADVLGHFAWALALACVGVFAVLVGLFRGWRAPAAIALALPLSAVGALMGLLVGRGDFGIVSLLGLVFLCGLASKNAIVLVDRVEQLRAAGFDCDGAILAAGAERLRPIFMTTAASILGMLPLALGLGAGAELRAPMAIAIIGGLLTSTALSLLVVPLVYRWLSRR